MHKLSKTRLRKKDKLKLKEVKIDRWGQNPFYKFKTLPTYQNDNSPSSVYMCCIYAEKYGADEYY